ncbi:MAG: hypothetical protein QW814_00120 [Methanothrix sp.]
MSVKKSQKTKKRKLPVKKREAKTLAVNYQPEPPDSYNHAIIRDLLSQHVANETNPVSAEAIIFSKIIMHLSMPPNEQYKSGFRLGKLYYNQAVISRPKWYEDLIPELTKLFQKLGYMAKYQISGSRNPSIILKSSANANLGLKMHSFEAGIMSGFLSGAKNAYMAMYESECACDGADECIFELGRKEGTSTDKNSLIRNFARHLATSHTKNGEHRDFSLLYNAMLLSTVKHVRGTMPEMHKLGEYSSKEFGLDKYNLGNSMRMISEIMRSVSASSSFESKGHEIKLTFDSLNSDSRYMDSLSQFASGLTNGAAKISVNLSDTGLSYALGISFDAKLLKLKNK